MFRIFTIIVELILLITFSIASIKTFIGIVNDVKSLKGE